MRNPPDYRNIRDFANLKQDDPHGGNGQQRPLRPGPSSGGVTIRPAKHLANAIPSNQVTNPSAKAILQDISPDLQKQDIDLIQSSLNETATPKPLQSDRNGFIHTAVNAYTERLGSFVAHDGKKELIIEDDSSPDRYSFDWAKFSQMITYMIQDHVVDLDLREWMMPNLSTTTENDKVVASNVMMASLQKYFEYTAMLTCGIPSVTLLGEKEDYHSILEKVEKLKEYGKEPTQFAELLNPVLKRFVMSFEHPESQEVLGFWNRIFSFFYFWNAEGEAMYPGQDKLMEESRRHAEDWDDELFLQLDGVIYHHVSSDDAPPGFATVPVKIVERNGETMAEMLAGSVGIKITNSGNVTAGGESCLHTLQPRSGWWIYEKLQKL